MAVRGEQATSVPTALADPRLEILLQKGRQINTLRSKIGKATEYLKKAEPTADVEEVALAREVLRGELDQRRRDASEYVPVVDELVSQFEEQIRSIQDRRKVNQGMAKIEELSGTPLHSSGYDAEAAADRMQISELGNLISALDELERDVTSRKDPVFCPRCSSSEITYKLSMTELGFSLYRCDSCSNAWRVLQFSLKVG